MNKSSKKWLLVLLTIVMVMVPVLTACGDSSSEGEADQPSKDEPQATAEGSEKDPYDDLPKELSISTLDRGRVSSDEGTYEENRWVDYIREESGIDVSIVPVPRKQSYEKLNVLVAAGQAPDLIWEYSRDYMGNLVTQGAIQPIGEYIEKYSTSYKEYLEENPDLLPLMTFEGEIYAATSRRANKANHGMFIRQDWLDELGLDIPKTMDELLAVAEAFKEAKPDSIPIVGKQTFVTIEAMYGMRQDRWFLEDDKMTYGATMDRYAEVLDVSKTLYENGLIDTEFLTDTNNQRAIQFWTTGKAGMITYNWGSAGAHNIMKDLYTNDPDAVVVPLEPVETPYGNNGLYQETDAFIYVAFNKDMKNPKAAIEYLDWMIDGGWVQLVNGEEGIHSELVDGVYKELDAEKFKKEVYYAPEYGVVRDQTFTPEEIVVKAADDEISQKVASMITDSWYAQTKYPWRRDFPYQPSFAEFSEIEPTIDTIVEEVRTKILLQSDKDGAWGLEEIRNEWERIGGLEADKAAQEWYNANKDSF
ncbi:extracellular solute-binding protein [Chengkuizengella axinellae]|uniref:Extracellular solute-binding protein n=1 Tax=Chengkuizengella axinellae TaxID=3064388 RepID=A0ABT9ITH2_9BACL|nr:extracellular solute-binding protein [Chengkuizengella sp. 2205SS18-9]MDP5272656.1 extracellular solute-binding protein [Chengkuizengella sp. 2205SS18-9]